LVIDTPVMRAIELLMRSKVATPSQAAS